MRLDKLRNSINVFESIRQNIILLVQLMEPNEKTTYLKKAPVEKSFFSQKFMNPFPIWKERSLRIDKLTSFFIENYKNQPDPEVVCKLLHPRTPDIQAPPRGVMRVTWISHATVLIQDGPVNILTDPVFANKVPEAPIGYRRLIKIPLEIERLPPIHILLISHDHSDHFDAKAVDYLIEKHNPLIIMGKKSEDLLTKSKRFRTLDWCEFYEEEIMGEKYKIDFLPSCHWSGRGVFDHFKRLWGAFILTTPNNKKIFYPGDTGHCKQLWEQISSAHGQIDVALLPIGAYEPRSFLCFQHINPDQAVKIHYLLHSKQSLGIHWGTFQLACEKFLQPREDLYKALKSQETYSQTNSNFCCVEPGQSLICGIDVTMPYFEGTEGLWATWLGHSTIVIQFDKQFILIDPDFSNEIYAENELKVRLRQTPIINLKACSGYPAKADMVLLTHSTADYVTRTKAFEHTDRNVYADERSISQKYQNRLVVMRNGDVLKQRERIQIKMFSNGQNCAFLLTFDKKYSIVVYGGYADESLAASIKNQEKHIDIAFIPIRPLISFKNTSVQHNDWDKIIKTFRYLNPLKAIATNWGAFIHPKDKSILQPKEEFVSQIEINKVKSTDFLCYPIGKAMYVQRYTAKSIKSDI